MEPVEAEDPVDAAVPQRQPKRIGAGEEDVVEALGGTLSNRSTEHPRAEVDADVGALQAPRGRPQRRRAPDRHVEDDLAGSALDALIHHLKDLADVRAPAQATAQPRQPAFLNGAVVDDAVGG